MNNHTDKPLLVICGSTATGKTNIALKLAKHFSGDLISTDSRQVYKQMDIGTGKDIPDCAEKKTFTQKSNMENIPYCE